MKVLITGASGMMGSHLVEFYLQEGEEVHVMVRPRSDLGNLKVKDGITFHSVDIRDSYGVLKVVQEGFDVIHHMAAITFVPYSWDNPHDTIETNVVGTINVLEAARRGFNPVIHIPGSSEEYGLINSDEVPIKETTLLRPHSPYGVSKVAQDLLAQQYHKNYGIKTVITRTFNHTSPNQAGYMIVPTLIRQALEIRSGQKISFFLGNLSAVREMIDWRDVIVAYRLAVQKCRYGEPYNVAIAKGYSVRELLEHVAKIAHTTTEYVQDPTRMRPTDIPVLVGDGTKFQRETGWEPAYTIMETLQAIYDYWKSRFP